VAAAGTGTVVERVLHTTTPITVNKSRVKTPDAKSAIGRDIGISS